MLSNDVRLWPCLGFHDRDVQKDVALHGEQEADRVRADIRGGNPARAGRKLRVPHGVDHARLHSAARLQLDPDWRPAGLEGLRNSDPYGQSVARQNLAGHPGAAGEGRDTDAVRQVVEEFRGHVHQE